MRKSFNTLSGLVLSMGFDVTAGDVFLFVAKNRKRSKTLWHDGTGLCLLAKRIDQASFAPIWRRQDSTGRIELTANELSLFLEGSEVIARRSLSPPVFDRAAKRRLSDADFS
jgi:transposase